MPQFAPGRASAPFSPDRLIASDFPIVTRTETLVSGQTLQRGALLGKITASGKFKLSASAASDGSEVPCAILVDDVDASASDKLCGLYFAGEFDESQLIFGAGHTAASVRGVLRDVSIFLVTTMPA